MILPLLLSLLSFGNHCVRIKAFGILPNTRTTNYININSVFTPRPTQNHLLRNIQLQSKAENYNDNEEEDDDDDIDLSDRDWRAFRAQLVMESSSTMSSSSELESDLKTTTAQDDQPNNEDLDGIGSLFNTNEISSTREKTPMTTENFTPLHPSLWAYDSGNVIEQGAVILGGVEQDFGFGLRQQYFHKAVILVLDHDQKFTKGIILNRPSDTIIVDNEKDKDGKDIEMKWRVWFGGDVQGLDSLIPEIVCLHSISTGNPAIDDQIDEVSATVMKDIKWTPFENAKELVRQGFATTSDFWVFAGYAGWGPEQLMGELERKSWYMCATDSQTLLKELAKQSALTDPRDAGLDTWELLMNLIGRGDTAEESSGDFEDLMLKEWVREKLLSVEGGGNAGSQLQPMMRSLTELFDSNAEPTFGEKSSVKIGSLIRAGSNERSPFLLEKQEFHKSIVLVIGDDEAITIGVILNQPSAKPVEMILVDKVTGEKRQLAIPIRYGGMYSIQGRNPLMWMHNKEDLKDALVGKPIGSVSGIWSCSQDDATAAIEDGTARPSDFIIASGISVWMKKGAGNIGLQGEIEKGNFEAIPESKYKHVWTKLQGQKDVLTKINLIQNISYGQEAWEAGGDSQTRKNDEEVVTEGIGEGFDEFNDSYVHNSDVRVDKLSDDALRSCKYLLL